MTLSFLYHFQGGRGSTQGAWWTLPKAARVSRQRVSIQVFLPFWFDLEFNEPVLFEKRIRRKNRMSRLNVFNIWAGTFAGLTLSLILSVGQAAVVSEGKTGKFEVNVEVSVDGDLVSSPHMVAPAGEMTSATFKNKKGEEMVLQLRASDIPKKGLKQGVIMRFAVGYNRDGKTDITSRSHLLSSVGEPAEVTLHDSKTSETIKLKAIATVAH
jgi:hypothetical protein